MMTLIRFILILCWPGLTVAQVFASNQNQFFESSLQKNLASSALKRHQIAGQTTPSLIFEKNQNSSLLMLGQLNAQILTRQGLHHHFLQRFPKWFDSAYVQMASWTTTKKEKFTHLYWRKMPSFFPVSGVVSSRYGLRFDPHHDAFTLHRGLDIAADYGAPIKASADGVVEFSGFSPGYGWLVVLTHHQGIKTKYAHNSKIFVRTHDKVIKGQVLALVGNTGHSTGSHLHFEVLIDDKHINPELFLSSHFNPNQVAHLFSAQVNSSVQILLNHEATLKCL